ncbi:hypothetical protein QQ045_026619 [Rhodiola kirilowii]
MFSMKLHFLVVALAVVAAAYVAKAQICNMKAEGMMACKTAVTPPNPSPPTEACCTALSHGDMACLCGYKHSPMLTALGINSDLAMELPDKCGIQHTPCN